MNINFGLFPELAPGAIQRPDNGKRFRGKEKAIAKKNLMAERALRDCREWLGLPPVAVRRDSEGKIPAE